MNGNSTECCHIPTNDPVFQSYHDSEWGVPEGCDQAFFEKICLEGFQVGLSWRTILHRRDNFRLAFADFCPVALCSFTDVDVTHLMQDSGLIRNERKIRSVINNAKRFSELKQQGKSLAALCWSFEPPTNQRPAIISNQWLQEHTHSAESIALAKHLKSSGWSFVGPTNLYALMQALGIVNDHVDGCPQREKISRLRKEFNRPC